MAQIGTLERPFTSTEGVKLAREVLEGVLRTPDGKRGLWWHQGLFWMWYGGRWQRRTTREMENEVLMRLEGSYVTGGGEAITPMRVAPRGVGEVVRCLEAISGCGATRLPSWVGEPGACPVENPEFTVAFRDCLVEVGTGRVVERTADWLDPVCLPVDWEGEAECPVWRRVVGEWGGGDEAWERLLQRWCGYVLLPWRGANRWLLKHGKIQAGKTTLDLVMKMLLGEMCVSTQMFDLAGAFGLGGLHHARYLCVNDAEELEREKSHRVSASLKVMVGQDFTSVNEKGMPIQRGVRLGCAVSVNANVMPNLANEGQGVSGKMLVLPYEHSMLGRADPGLPGKLERELKGVAKWMMEGARQVVEAVQGGRNPWEGCLARTAEEHVWAFRVRNNPWDSFLEARFVQLPGAFVPSRLMWREWLDFVRENQVNMRVARNMLSQALVERSTWDLRRHRRDDGERGVLGLALRREAADEGREVPRDFGVVRAEVEAEEDGDGALG